MCVCVTILSIHVYFTVNLLLMVSDDSKQLNHPFGNGYPLFYCYVSLTYAYKSNTKI